MPAEVAQPRPVLLSLPFSGLWKAKNSPASRVPSHGVDLLGQRFAIDFIGVDDSGRSASHRDWRSFLATEPKERFAGFGRPILAPCAGSVVTVHDGEADHAARRSQLALIPYALGQAGRLRQGLGAIAGNHVIIALRESNTFVALVHLRAGTLRVEVGDSIEAGQTIAECGNSGNSTEPHVHVQAMDSADLSIARGVPMAFRDFRERRRGSRGFLLRTSGMPGEGSVIESVPAGRDGT